MPLFPFHGWMPDAYRAMPLPVLAIFSGVLSKVAAYGFLRIVLPLFPDAAQDFQSLILILALLSILYGSAQAFTQTNARLVLGYSSIAQLGFIVLGVFALDPEGRGAQGAILQMVNHGLVVAPLFLIIVLLSERAGGTEDITKMGGLAFRGPVLASLFLIVALATLAMPGAANFVGEFLILLGLFETKMWIAIIAFTGVAMASVYMLRMFIRTMHNRPGEGVESRELRFGDAFVIVPLTLAILAFALYPQAALTRLRARRQGREPAGGAMKGPTIDWAAISPLIALTAGACVVLMVGCCGRRSRATGGAGADGADARRRRRARRLAVGREHERDRGRAGDRRPDARAADDLRAPARWRRCCCRCGRWPRSRRARASTTRCCSSPCSGWSCSRARRTSCRCSSASSCSRSPCTSCARRSCGARRRWSPGSST